MFPFTAPVRWESHPGSSEKNGTFCSLSAETVVLGTEVFMNRKQTADAGHTTCRLQMSRKQVTKRQVLCSTSPSPDKNERNHAMKQYEMAEFSFSGNEPDAPALAKVTAVFSNDGKEKTVEGFYAGNGIYKVRFYPMEAGTYTYRVMGDVTAEGSFTTEPASRHGMVRAIGTHFEYEDGTYFYPFGTTIYALAHQTKALIDKTLDTLSKAPFNKVRLCLFPKDYLYNKNDPSHFAFTRKADGTWDVTHPDYVFWDEFEDTLKRLDALGIQADLILFHPYDRWGFSKLSMEENRIYLSYLLRRLAAFPNLWWSLANEYDFVASKSLQDWEEIEVYVHDHDPYHHPESCHNGCHYWDAGRPAITHCSLQVKSLPVVSYERKAVGKPVIVDECCYEGNLNQAWGAISGQEMTARFWQAVAQGGYCTHGETFLDPDTKDEDNAVVFWSKGGSLQGESPARIRWLRDLVESLPGPLDPQQGRFSNLVDFTSEEINRLLPLVPESTKALLTSFNKLTDYERGILRAGEYNFAGQVGEKAYLWYLYRQTCARYLITLPKDKTYKVEVLDTWNMTRSAFADHVSGEVQVRLPGKEFMAILATVES